MNYLRGAFSAASQYYKDINPSTLTGAIDVIVVRRSTDNGAEELACSPFHVRFGKWQVLRPAEKTVMIQVNGESIPYHMKIGDAGEAFFVFEADQDVPEDLITSPLLEATQDSPRTSTTHDTPNGVTTEVVEGGQPLVEPDFLDLNAADENLKTPRPADLLIPILPRPGNSSSIPQNKSNASSPNLLGQTTAFGKGVFKAAVELERESASQAKDKLQGAKNIMTNMYSGPSNLTHSVEKGDEALRRVKPGEGDPPEVQYSDHIALDMSGYHSKEQSGQTVTPDVAISIPSSPSPSSSSDRSRSGSPELSPGPSSSRLQSGLNVPFPRASSEPPELTPKNSPPEYEWEWGAFPQRTPIRTSFPNHHHHPSEELKRSATDPVSDTDLTQDRSNSLDSTSSSFGQGGKLAEDEEDENKFLLQLGDRTYEFELSLCGGSMTGHVDELQDAQTFTNHQVSFKRFMKSPEVVRSEDLVMRWNDRYISRRDQSPLLSSLANWRHAALASRGTMPVSSDEELLSSSDERERSVSRTGKPQVQKHRASSSWVRWWRSSQPSEEPATSNERPMLQPGYSEPVPDSPVDDLLRPNATESKQPTPSTSTSNAPKAKRFAKTLRLTSDQLKQLKLNSGPNTITFSLATTGTVACTARIFLWDSTDSIVVSDIDGTITKSDALGHVFTMMGRDWTHLGVAKLYTDIRRNGYKIMYLTSRAIGQADSTRGYLKGINQNNYQLPEGPVVMSPDRLMASLHREVIMRKPEVFKMACLRDIQRLFGKRNPFYAGFGNRITDALSYRSVDIPSARIFTIDSTGVVKMELLEVAGYKSSYILMTDLVDQMFPPLSRTWEPEFTDSNYWKTPLEDFPLPDFSPPSPALSARSDTSNQSAFSRIRNFSLGRKAGAQFSKSEKANENRAAESRLRQISSLDRLTTRLVGTPEAEELSSQSTLVDDEYERRRSRRLSSTSMPGSLPGSDDSASDEELRFGDYDDDQDPQDGDYDSDAMTDGEEDADHIFDDELLATGEMKNVPYL